MNKRALDEALAGRVSAKIAQTAQIADIVAAIGGGDKQRSAENAGNYGDGTGVYKADQDSKVCGE
jgi:hypothetical protein